MSLEALLGHMLGAGEAIDPRLAQAAAEAEAGGPARRVVAGRVFRLPYARLRARVALQAPRRFNILEEFVLRAVAELEPPPAPAELASLLGLDQLFIDATLRQLEALKTVSRGPGGGVRLTTLGRKYFAHGQAEQPAEHRALRLLYRGGLDELRLWNTPPAAAGDLPVVPGLPEAAREHLAQDALAAVTVARVAPVAGELAGPPHGAGPAARPTAVDQVEIDDQGFAACGVLVIQDLLAEGDNVTVRAVDVETQAPDEALQRRLDEWLGAGRMAVSDFLPPAWRTPPPAADESEAGAEAGPEQDYLRVFREQTAAGRRADGVELLRAGEVARHAEPLKWQSAHSLLLLRPTLDAADGQVLAPALAGLAERGVMTVIGWGTAEDREHEPQAPPAATLDALHHVHTPEGLPATAVWWVGDLYGQDVLLDRTTLISSVPNALVFGGQRLPGGAATYLVTAPDLVSAAAEELEPPLARAARLGWQSAARSAQGARRALERCCLTWVAIRRPSEALSHVLKLAAGEHEAMGVAWELFTLTCLALAAFSADDLSAMGALPALRRALPEFLDWADSAAGQPQAPFVAPFRELLGRYAHADEAKLPELLAAAQRLWAEAGRAQPGATLAEAFTVASEAKPAKRRR